MDGKTIGIAVGGGKVADFQAAISQAEQAGIQAVWATTGGARLDSITVFAAAVGATTDIKFGTSIVPIFPRHPLVMVQQAQVIAQLAPGRFRLGVGPSHRPTMRAMGIRMPSPLGNLRKYLRILKGLLQKGEIDYQGAHYQVNDRLAEPVDIPVMASALQRGSFELCGAEADGAISWVCPASYLRDVALPAMEVGADQAGRPSPLPYIWRRRVWPSRFRFMRSLSELRATPVRGAPWDWRHDTWMRRHSAGHDPQLASSTSRS